MQTETQLTISKAIELSPVSKATFYKNYINTGVISVDRSDPKNPYVDISELLRVFGAIQEPKSKKTKEKTEADSPNTDHTQLKLAVLEKENEGLKELIASLKDQAVREREIADVERHRAQQAEERYSRLLENKKDEQKLNARLYQKLNEVSQQNNKPWWEIW